MTKKVTFDRKMEGFVIFVYAHDYAREVDDNGNPTPSTSKGYGFNFGKDLAVGFTTINTNGARPWFFDQTPDTADDVPMSDHYEIVTTMVHEFGHILGFARNRQAPFVKSFGTKDERFCGPAAMKVNGGRPVPLEFDSSHIRGDWWKVDYRAIPADPYVIKDDPRKSDAERNFGISGNRLNPIGLWLFDNRESAGSAIIGYPLRYSPPSGKTGGQQ